MTPDGNHVVEETADGRNLVVTGPWSDASAGALLRGEVDGLVLNYARGFEGTDIDFLDQSLCVRRLNLLDRGIADLGPIARLADSLEKLSVQAAEGAELDLAALPHLHSVGGEWALICGTLSSVDELRSVITWRFGEVDLHAFRDDVHLERLTIKEALYLESLSGIGDLSELAVLEIIGARNLSDMSDVTGLAESLREFMLETCPLIDTLDDIEPLVNLRVLGISECGDIDSLAPLGALLQLEELYAWGSTQIVDGDLSPLVQLPRLAEIRMRDRRTYEPRVSDLVASRST